MREVNFSIPSVNKAAVNITTTLYDRRALDCTSTLPLINSLNHLAYLTTSSDRIRDILTVDGGIEQLVCILKAGRSKDLMEMWKWNLAFQCVVNIGVRGSENVRTRVVEADMVPVIATILDNYIRVVDRIRASSSAAASTDPEASRSKQHKTAINTTTTSTTNTTTTTTTTTTSIPTSSTSSRRDQPPRTSRASFYDHRSDQRNARRQAPPPSIEIPLPYAQDGPEHNTATTNTATTAATTATTAATEGRHNNLHTPIDVQPSPHIVLTSPPERTTFNHHHHHHHPREGHRHRIMQPLASATVATAAATTTPTTDPFNPIRQVRDVDRLPSALPGLQAGITSQPESPTTPLGAGAPQANIPPLMPRIFHRRPSVRQQRSASGESDDADAQPEPDDNDIIMGEGDLETTNVETAEQQPIVDLDSSGMDLEDINMRDRDAMLDDASTVNAPTQAAQAATSPANGHPPTHAHARQPNGHQAPGVFNNPYPFYLQNQNQNQHHQPSQSQSHPQSNPHSHSASQPHSSRSGNPAGPTILAAMPRDEDVLLALQLLAYVSKYCNLRSYFQQTHLVPRLKIGKELEMLDEANPLPASTSSSSSGPSTSAPSGSNTTASPQTAEEAQEEMEEYILPDDFNIFPLVEKFTVRHHTKDMQYWACVVMRNLCRKDDSRGGIRQCAYYKCGKWEEFQRQFAKCRRCRRTKYCSKECQKSAWVYHRHWCHSSPEH
ncbi:TPA_exp: putative MYND domain protein (SamB) [Trichophyton benhamiae CBS 112371]|nr:TPA_exp: putative MYND domain protein (SamB) [Trichophyton benhamiae CBS 112371]